MADGGQIKQTVVKVLCCVEKVSSFASSFDPIFGIVTTLVGVARQGLVDEEGHPLDKDFQEINSKLSSISQKNKECLKAIRIHEVNENYGIHEERIKSQYGAFNQMLENAKKDPDQTAKYMNDFKKVYEQRKQDMGLDVYYRGVVGSSQFGRNLLKVYFDNCDGDRKIMGGHCSHIAHLFHMGLISLMAYTAIDEDDEDAVRDKWTKRVNEIQQKMEEVLGRCRDESS